jgi:hypothetical protein
MVVALTVLLAPVTAAHRSVIYSAPFSKAAVQIPNYTSTYGCSKLSAKTMHFSLATGTGTWASTASAHWCAKTLGMVNQGYAGSSGQTIIDVPVKAFAGTATHTTVAVTWSIHGSAAATLGYGGVACPPAVVNNTSGNGFTYCSLSSGAGVVGWAYLIDRTNGSIVYPGNYPTLLNLYDYTYNDTYCYSFVCYTYNNSGNSPTTSWSGTSTQTWWINATLNHSHQYIVETYVYAYVYAGVYVAPKCSAAANLVLAGGTNGVKLVSIVVR